MTIDIVERPPNHLFVDVPKDLARIGGQFHITVDRADGSKENYDCKNLIPDIGIKHLGDILAAVETTNIDLGYMEAGSGTTAAVIGDTDTETPLTTAARIAASSQTRSATTPYEVVIAAFISSVAYTRPQTINELCVFFTPDVTGDLFARGVLTTGITLNTNDTATISYGIVFR